MSARPIRCAVYTRKSSEEGLEQAFNSLDAQREAGLDYIKSQKHQGWVALPECLPGGPPGAGFDDGGYSGGSMDRPGLQRLLTAIDAGRVDVVVVYKVDRLSRSLADFARLMQRFDERGVSFVAVTQQFNTTTSMGRLTLNMLLSFAQFEREVTGERIRDKIAATKRRGMWIGGRPPLGYRLPKEGEERVLRVVPKEAAVVRAIFEGYLECRSLVALAARLNAAGHTTKRWAPGWEGTKTGLPFQTTYLYRVLTNPLYVGKITHTKRRPPEGASPGSGAKETLVFDGLHEPIIDRALWDRVNAAIRVTRRAEGTRWAHTHLLKGKVRTSDGWALSPSHTRKRGPSGGGAGGGGGSGGEHSSVGYYVSQKALKHGYAACAIRSLNAGHLDTLVRGVVLDYARDALGAAPRFDESGARDAWLRGAIERVVVATDILTIEVRREALASVPEPPKKTRDRAPAERLCRFTPEVTERGGLAVLRVPVSIKRLDGRRLLLSPDGHDLLALNGSVDGPAAHAGLVAALGKAYRWHRDLERSGESFREYARRVGLAPSRVHALLALTNLGPPVLRAVLTGRHPSTLSIRDLLAASKRLDWSTQCAMLRITDREA